MTDTVQPAAEPMTQRTTQPTTQPTTRRTTGPSTPPGIGIAPGRGSRIVRYGPGYLVVAATIPYLSLKVAWLTGGTVGLADPTLAQSPGLTELNLATAGLDAVAILLALALTHRWGLRVPAALLLVPIWVGTGLLAPIAIGTPAAALGALFTGSAPGAAVATMPALRDWVQPLVYGGFTVQAVGLLVAFLGYVRVRWPGVWHPVAPTPGAAAGAGVASAIGTGAAVLGGAVGVAQLATGGGLTGVVHALLTVAGALGVVVLLHLPGRLDRGVVAAAWVGTAATFGWGSYAVVNVLAATVFGAGQPAQNLLNLGKVIAGLLLGVALLLLLAQRTQEPHPAVARPGPRR